MMMAAARKGAAKPGARKGRNAGKGAGKGARKGARPARPDAALDAVLDDGERDAASGPERRCIVTGQVLPKDRLIRFVAGPDGVVVPDLAAVLPGRGLWLLADRASVEKAVLKGHFAKAARAQVKAPPDLAASGAAHDGRSGPGAPVRRAGPWLRSGSARIGGKISACRADRCFGWCGRWKTQDSGARTGPRLAAGPDRGALQFRIELGPGPRKCDTRQPQTGAACRKADL